MGIRIHKVLGYGLLHAKFKNDPRFNDIKLEGDLKPRLVDFVKSKETSIEREFLLKDLEGIKSLDEYSVIKRNWGGECNSGPIVFTIPIYKDWYRYDDIIDYIEEGQRTVLQDGGCEDKVQIITDCEGQATGIYPYCSYVHREHGELGRNLFVAAWQRHIVPDQPYFIRAFCECFNIFKDPRMIRRLRPMLYTYWC